MDLEEICDVMEKSTSSDREEQQTGAIEKNEEQKCDMEEQSAPGEEEPCVENSAEQKCDMEEQSAPGEEEPGFENNAKEECILMQSCAPEDTQEQQSGEEDNVDIETEQNNIFLTDSPGEPYVDGIIDYTARREPISVLIDSDWESDSSSSSTSTLSSLSSLEDLRDERRKTMGRRQPKPVKTKGELGIEDLPPVEELFISVPEDDMKKIGMVYSIVDKLVVVESYMNSPPLDLDSVLFLPNGKPLGHVFEVFGPVKQPYYLIRFNSNEDIVTKGISKEDGVFYAPSHSDVTNFIFTDELMRQKGSDASWEHNNEPPDEHVDFSDDEKEKAARSKRNAKNRKPASVEDTTVCKRRNTSCNDRDAETPDVTVVYSSKKSNYFHQYRNTGSSANYSPSVCAPVQGTNQNLVGVTSPYRMSTNFTFSWAMPSQPRPPQRVPFSSFSSPARPSGILPIGAGSQAMAPPLFRTPGIFSFSSPPPSQQLPLEGVPAQQVPLHPTPMLSPAPINPTNCAPSPLCSSFGNFSSQPPPPSQPPPQGVPSQQSALPLSPAPGPVSQTGFALGPSCRNSGNLSFSLPPPCLPGLPQRMPSQQVPPHQNPVALSPAPGIVNPTNFTPAPSHRNESNISFSLPPPSQLGPPQRMPSQQTPLPLSSVPNSVNSMNFTHGPLHRSSLNFSFSSPLPSQLGPPQTVPTQQISHQQAPVPLPPTPGPANPTSFASTPSFESSGDFSSPPSPSQLGAPQRVPFQQTPVPLSPARSPANVTNRMPFQGANQNSLVPLPCRIQGNFSSPPASQPMPPQGIPVQQTPVHLPASSGSVNTTPVSVGPASGSPNVTNHIPFQGANLNPMVAPPCRTQGNFPFTSSPASQPIQQQGVPFQQTPKPLPVATVSVNTTPVSLSPAPASANVTNHIPFQGINPNPIVPPPCRAQGNFPFSSPPTSQPIPQQGVPCHQTPVHLPAATGSVNVTPVSVSPAPASANVTNHIPFQGANPNPLVPPASQPIPQQEIPCQQIPVSLGPAPASANVINPIPFQGANQNPLVPPPCRTQGNIPFSSPPASQPIPLQEMRSQQTPVPFPAATGSVNTTQVSLSPAPASATVTNHILFQGTNQNSLVPPPCRTQGNFPFPSSSASQPIPPQGVLQQTPVLLPAGNGSVNTNNTNRFMAFPESNDNSVFASPCRTTGSFPFSIPPPPFAQPRPPLSSMPSQQIPLQQTPVQLSPVIRPVNSTNFTPSPSCNYLPQNQM